jgi:hypothetical protein
MTAISDNPTNKNFLSPLNFKFRIKKTPALNFFVQKINVPRMELPSPEQPNMFTRIPRPGDHLNFSDLQITFKVDEDLQNYMEIYTWMVQMARSKDYEQYQTIDSKKPMTGEGIYSDLELEILSSKRRANYAVVFEDAFPTDLGEFEFDTTLEDVNYVTASVTFKYKLYTIEKI